MVNRQKENGYSVIINAPPSPTSMLWSVLIRTSLATPTAFFILRRPQTAPTSRVGLKIENESLGTYRDPIAHVFTHPSMTMASSVVSPFSSGLEPHPTDPSHLSISHCVTPATAGI